MPGLDDVTAWLERNRPPDGRPGLLDGDYHLGNVMFDPCRPRVQAIVGWEMCTVGDPLLVLGWLVVTWPEGTCPVHTLQPVHRLGGLPTATELIERYAAGSARPVDAMAWYVVLACFKLGILLDGTYARSRAGKADPDVGRELRATAHQLFERAHDTIATGL